MKVSHNLQLHLLVVLWGFTGVFGKLVTISAIPLVWWRMFIGAVSIYLYLRAKGAPLRVSGVKFLVFLGGGLILALHWICFFHSIQKSNVSIGLSCLSLGALFTVFLEPMFFRRPVRIYEFVLALVVAVCLIVILYSGGREYVWGVVFGALSSFLSAVFNLLNAILLRKDSPQTITFYEMSGGVACITVFLLIQGGMDDIVQIGMKDLFWVSLLGTIFTAYSMITLVKLMRYISPYTLMITVNLEPVYGILLACFLFGEAEKMDAVFYVAVSVMLSAIFFNQWIQKKLCAKG